MESIQVDEVEIAERTFLLELLPYILQLSYASLCNDAIWNSIKCEGCEFNWPSQKDHLCMTLWDDEEDAWYYYYDEAIQVVDSNRVWELAQQVATCRLDILIHPSWKNYIDELYKQPRTSVYLTYFQIQCLGDQNDDRVDSIWKVLKRGKMKVHTIRKTLTKASLIVYPVKKSKTEGGEEEEENMNIDCLNL